MIAVVRETPELKGSVSAPSSKSYTHRTIIAATLSKGRARIESPLFCEDTEVTLKACQAFGAEVAYGLRSITLSGPEKLRAPAKPIDCGESGSTMRFLIPIAALAGGRTVLTGSPSLVRRPVDPLVEAVQDLGAKCISENGYPPVTVQGVLTGGKASIVGDVSSQFITGLLFACPLAKRDTEVTVTTPLESKPYIRLTLNILKKHGIVIGASAGLRRFQIPGKQSYTVCDHVVPGDYSSAAFLMAAAALTGSSITIRNLSQEPDQPDIEILSILKSMGAEIKVNGEGVTVRGAALRGVDMDARDIPDLVAVVAALGCMASGTTRILKAGRLRLKESDRLSSIMVELRKFGAKVRQEAGSLEVEAPPVLKAAEAESHNDHRIAMACAVLGLVAKGETRINGAECVAKSYPRFFDDMRNLGGDVTVS
jgi:3-phosphoshikimate 1-carboxyvinyltransferase